MSPVHHTMRFARRTNIGATPSQTAGVYPTAVLIRQDTVAPSTPTFVARPATTTTISNVSASESATTHPSRGMSGGTKIGLAMIPVVVMLVGLYILFLFWFRKRRAARRSIRGSISPPVPEKDISSYNSSIASRRRSSKVFHMSAFSTPIHDGRFREAQFLGERAPQQTKVAATKEGEIQNTVVAAPTRSPHMVEAELDSPIDASSPFRLKRGDTVKRCSIGPELARLWPSPPTSVWLRPLNCSEEFLAPVTRRENSVYQQRPVRNME